MIRRFFACWSRPDVNETAAASGRDTGQTLAPASSRTDAHSEAAKRAARLAADTGKPPQQPGPQAPGAAANTPRPAAGAGPDAAGCRAVGFANAASLRSALEALARKLLRQDDLTLIASESLPWIFLPGLKRLYVPRAVFDTHSCDGVRGALIREIGRWLYSRGPGDSEPLTAAFALLWHGTDQIRTSRLIGLHRPGDGLAADLAAYFRESAATRQLVVAGHPLYAQEFLCALIATGLAPGRAQNGLRGPVQEALRAVAADLERQLAPPAGLDLSQVCPTQGFVDKSAADFYDFVRSRLWPRYEQLLARDVATLAALPPGSLVLSTSMARQKPSSTRGLLDAQAQDAPPTQRARQALLYHLTHLARAEAPPAPQRPDEETARLGEARITWEQMSRCKTGLQTHFVDDAEPRTHRVLLRARLQPQHDVNPLLPFTAPYDRIAEQQKATIVYLRQSLRDVLQKSRRSQVRRHQSSGNFDLRAGIQAEHRRQVTGTADQRVFTRRQPATNPAQPAFLLGVDCSSSMAGPNIASAHQAVVVFQEALADLNILSGTIGYNSDAWVVLPLGHSPAAQRNLALAHLVPQRTTNDPQALALAGRMFAACDSGTIRPILLMLTDGEADTKTSSLVREMKQERKIETIGIGIGQAVGSVQKTYPCHVTVPTVQDLPARLAQVLENCLRGVDRA